jgi:hypothetical protein
MTAPHRTVLHLLSTIRETIPELRRAAAFRKLKNCSPTRIAQMKI